MVGLYILYGVLALIAIFIIIVLVRTLSFKPKKEEVIAADEIEFDKEKAVKNLQTLVRFKTVSNKSRDLEDENEFQGLINSLSELFPNVTKTCELIKFPDHGLLFKWKGQSSEKAAVMMAHFDVVPVNESEWTKPAFEGLIEDGILWGRGTLDTKVTFSGSLTAVDHLISTGFKPKYDVYLSYSGNEEVNGPGVIHIVDYLEKNGISPYIVVDEGGAVVDGVFPGVKCPTGLIGIAEKGLMNVTYTCKSSGGHASAPKPHTPVGILADACCKIENNPMKMRLSKPVAEMFDTLARRSTFAYRMIFSNMWCFGWILDVLTKKTGGDFNAMLRTTIAFTQMEGSLQNNVIPPEAKMVSNIRINPCDSIAKVKAHLEKTINNPNITLEISDGDEPSRISQTDCDGWNIVKNAVANTWKGCVVSPYLMVQCSDSRRYGRISDKVYRFSACDMTAEERKTIHGNDEHIRIETISKAVEFYIRVIREL